MNEFFFQIGWGWTYAIYILVFCYGERFIMGKIVEKTRMKVNYSRKINHFFLFFSQIYISGIFGNSTLDFLGGVIAVALLALSYNKYSRTKLWSPLSGFLSICFKSFDRPEDRPCTLKWLLLQYAGSYAIVIPAMLIFRKLGWQEFAYIPLLVNAIGDGLAEPVGITWGKNNRYSVKPIFWNKDKEYYRSWAGSGCVYFCGLLIIFFHSELFAQNQFWAAMLFIPAMTTVAEAKSPHTVDSPLILLVGYIALGSILWFF
jgi:dolichol kinase